MKFKGCNCATFGLPCWNNSRKCACQLLNRECDPDLCDSCGAKEVAEAKEVADPFKHDRQTPPHACNNVAIQRGIGKHLLVGRSSHPGDIGFGAFLAEPARCNELVSEYIGEIISAAEADRRAEIYDRYQVSYLFTLNKEMVIDGYRYGNKERFINHSAINANIYIRVKYVNGEHRIGLYAMRNLVAGEELFFDYGEDFVEKHGLKEMMEAPQQGRKNARRELIEPELDLLPIIPDYDTDDYDEEDEYNGQSSASRERPVKRPRREVRKPTRYTR